MTSRAGKTGRGSKIHVHKAMVGKRLANPPYPVFVPGLGAVYCMLARGCLTAKLSAGLGS